jgi:SAM-dependent methyltransferase
MSTTPTTNAAPRPHAALEEQYEAYPYPTRDPREEEKRLVTGSPSHLAEVEHFVFGGRVPAGRPGERPLRVLFAGGGTGDAITMLAQQLADRSLSADITYLDLSTTSRDVARARLERRGLAGSVRFITGSLLDVATLAPGPFDYIDCCGVLHHLPSPEAGLKALAAVLHPQGGIGMMVYGEYGREGVYPLQAALRALTIGQSPAARVATARKLLAALPPTNGLRRNPFLHDHRQSDAALFDLLLHSCDRAYTVPQLAELFSAADLAVSRFMSPAAYDPAWWVREPTLLKPLQQASLIERAIVAEQLSGAMHVHIAYLASPQAKAKQAAFDGPDWIAVPGNNFDPKLAAKAARGGKGLSYNILGVSRQLDLPPLAAAMLERIDGQRSFGAIHQELNNSSASAGTLDWERQFVPQVQRLLAALVPAGCLMLRHEG